MLWLVLISSLALMLVGANVLTRGCARIATIVGASQFIVSVIIIGIGTSLPELFVSFISGARDMGTLVASNNIASNIINIFGVLGAGAFLSPIALNGRRHLSAIAFMCTATVATAALCMFGAITFWGGILLLAILVIYFVWEYRARQFPSRGGVPSETRRGGFAHIHSTLPVNFANAKSPPLLAHPTRRVARGPRWRGITTILFIILGILALYFGSQWFMNSLQVVARIFGMSETMMGILIVAPATAMPEFMVTIIASIHRNPQIAVGNIVGSNFMNLALVIPAGALMIPLPVPSHIAHFDVWVMVLATAVLCYDILVRRKLSRMTGVVYLTLLAAYLWASIVI